MKEKDGRPPVSIAAWRSLQARQEMESRFPDVVALIDQLAFQNVDPRHVDAAVARALASLDEGRNRSREQLPEKASVAERQLHAAAEVERLSEDRKALATLSAAVEAELRTVASELATAETRLRQVMLLRDPIIRFEQELAGRLRAAGLTDKHAR